MEERTWSACSKFRTKIASLSSAFRDDVLFLSAALHFELRTSAINQEHVEMPSRGPGSQLVARVILGLLILVPFGALLAVRNVSMAWLAWTVLSLWAAVEAAQITSLAFPENRSHARTFCVALLAGANAVMSLILALAPSTWISSFR